MPPQSKGRGSLPFLILLAFAAVFLYSYSSLLRPPQFPTPNPRPQNFTFTIKLLTFDRLPSLRRCLRSLAAADYAADRADLHLFLDHGSNLGASHQILDFIDRFDWIHGNKLVHYRTGNAGLQAQWLEAWWPASDDDFAFVVEDDLEVSPLYYRFLKRIILRY